MAVSQSVKPKWYGSENTDTDRWYGASALSSFLHKLQMKVSAGAASGANITITGITPGDQVISVMHFAGAGTFATITDRTSVTTITAQDTIQIAAITNNNAADRIIIWWAVAN